MNPQDPAVLLAQRLAANDKKTRDRAVRKLRAYLRARSQEETGGFTEDDFLKIWKGLFYCLWMQDKPLLQEDLAQNISQLIHALHSKQTKDLFLSTFWQTLSREWNGIDRLRMDKFFTLTRLIFRQSVELLKKAEWEESLIEEFLSLLVKEVLQGAETPRGVQLHLIDIYLEELAKVGAAELPAELNLKFIEPFTKMAAKTQDPLLLQSLLSGIFQCILDQAPFAIEDLMKELKETPRGQESGWGDSPGDLSADGSEAGNHSALEDEEDVGPVLQFDYQAVADRLLALASKRGIPAHNRKRLYRLVKQFQDLAEGIFPQDEFPEEVSTDEDDDEFSSWRFRKREKKRAQERSGTDTLQDEIQPLKRREKRQSEVTITEGSLKPQDVTPPSAKNKRRKKEEENCQSTQKTPPHPAVNGVKPQRSTKRKRDLDVAHHTPTPDSTLDSTPAQQRRLHLKKRRRGGLIRLELSVLPSRSSSLRRRILLERCRIKKLKVLTSPSQHKVMSAQPESISLCQMSRSRPASARHKAGQRLTAGVSPPKVTSASEFVSFCKMNSPKPVYVKAVKGKGGQIRSKINCKSKKVTFSLNKNMTAEFKRTDRSLLVSPTGSSRVPFNPEQRPPYSVLKTPSPKTNSRPRAADFF